MPPEEHPRELDRLSRAGPDLGDMLPEFLAPFEARALRRAKVLWLNHRYLRGLGIDIDDPRRRDEVERLLLDRYAACVPGPTDDLDHYSDERIAFGADCYGSTGGAVHGGSGRVGVRDGLNVKGIGRTPLVAEAADWYHSHGCLWVEEAIREAVYSELADVEFSHGAVPVVAVLATGHRIYWDDGSTGSERALLIRPNFLRLAHFQRSLFFGTSGFPGSDQVRDAERVRQGLARLWGDGRDSDWEVGVEDLGDCVGRIGRQIGESHFWRLWPGPFFSSNMTVDGRFLDYGSFRAVPDWRRLHGASSDPGFGDEWPSLLPTVNSLRFNVGKHAPGGAGSSDLTVTASSAIAEGFQSGVAELLGVDPDLEATAIDDAVASMRRRFAVQQAQRVDAAQISEPLHGDIIADLMKALAGRSSRLSRINATAERTFKPRPDAARETLQSLIEEMLESTSHDSGSRRGAVSRLVSKILTMSRRRWRGLPRGAVVADQIYDEGHWLVVYETLAGEGRLRLESPRAHEWDLRDKRESKPTIEADDHKEWSWPLHRPLRLGILVRRHSARR